MIVSPVVNLRHAKVVVSRQYPRKKPVSGMHERASESRPRPTPSKTKDKADITGGGDLHSCLRRKRFLFLFK